MQSKRDSSFKCLGGTWAICYQAYFIAPLSVFLSWWCMARRECETTATSDVDYVSVGYLLTSATRMSESLPLRLTYETSVWTNWNNGCWDSWPCQRERETYLLASIMSTCFYGWQTAIKEVLYEKTSMINKCWLQRCRFARNNLFWMVHIFAKVSWSRWQEAKICEKWICMKPWIF